MNKVRSKMGSWFTRIHKSTLKQLTVYSLFLATALFLSSCSKDKKVKDAPLPEPQEDPTLYYKAVPNWFDKELLRALMGGTSNLDDLTTTYDYWRKIKSKGMNTIVHTYYKNDNYLEEIDRDGKEASKIGIHLIPQIFFYQDFERSLGFKLGLPEAIDVRGKTASEIMTGQDGVSLEEHFIACPTEPLYWEKVMAEPSIEIAKLSTKKRRMIDGINFNIKIYGPDYVYSPFFQINAKKWTNGTYCDKDFYKFLESKGLTEEVEKSLRHDFLTNAGILYEYADFLSQEMENIFYPILNRIHDINPELVLTAYPALTFDGFNNWFYNGFYRALGRVRHTIAMASSYQAAPILESPSRFLNIYKSLDLPQVYGPSSDGWDGRSDINLSKSLSLYTAGGHGYYYYDYHHVPDSVLDNFEKINKKLDDGLQASGGRVYHDVIPTSQGSFIHNGILLGAVPLASYSNIIPEASQNLVSDNYYTKTYFSIPVSQETEKYLLTYDVHFEGNHNIANIVYEYTYNGVKKRVDSHSMKDIHALKKNQTARSFSAFIEIPPGVSTVTLWCYGFADRLLRGLTPDLTGKTYFENGVMVNTEDITWVKADEAISETLVPVGGLPGQAYDVVTYRYLQTSNGFVLIAGNMGNIPIRGHAWFENLEEETYVVSIPFKKVIYKSPTGNPYWTKNELSEGLSVTVMPRSGEWIVLSSSDEFDNSLDFDLIEYSEVENDDALLSDQFSLLLPDAKKIETHFFTPSYENRTRPDDNLLLDSSFEDENSSWSFNGSSFVVSELTSFANITGLRDGAVDGGYFVSLQENDSISQAIELTKQSNIIRGYYRSLSGGAVDIDVKDLDGNPVATKQTINLFTSENVWLYFEYPIETSITGSATISFTQTSGDIEIDQLKFY